MKIDIEKVMDILEDLENKLPSCLDRNIDREDGFIEGWSSAFALISDDLLGLEDED